MLFGRSGCDWMIVGLGNPGKQYERTRHNCGFRALDALAEKLGCKVNKVKFQGMYCQTNYNGKKLFLLKPQTYMNLSGRSVLQLSAYYSIPPQRIIVMFDDISLEPGRLRIRGDGSAEGSCQYRCYRGKGLHYQHRCADRSRQHHRSRLSSGTRCHRQGRKPDPCRNEGGFRNGDRKQTISSITRSYTYGNEAGLFRYFFSE